MYTNTMGIDYYVTIIRGVCISECEVDVSRAKDEDWLNTIDLDDEAVVTFLEHHCADPGETFWASLPVRGTPFTALRLSSSAGMCHLFVGYNIETVPMTAGPGPAVTKLHESDPAKDDALRVFLEAAGLPSQVRTTVITEVSY